MGKAKFTAQWDEEANCHTVMIPATLVTLPTQANKELDNEFKTPYAWATVETNYGDEEREPETLGAIVWGTSIDKGVFDGLVDSEVMVRVNVDGEAKGIKILQLPPLDELDWDAFELEFADGGPEEEEAKPATRARRTSKARA